MKKLEILVKGIICEKTVISIKGNKLMFLKSLYIFLISVKLTKIYYKKTILYL